MSAVAMTPEQVRSDLNQDSLCKSTFKGRPVDKQQTAADENRKKRQNKLSETFYPPLEIDQAVRKHSTDLSGKLSENFDTLSVEDGKGATMSSHYGSLKRPAMSTPYKCTPVDLKLKTSSTNQSVRNTFKSDNDSSKSP